MDPAVLELAIKTRLSLTSERDRDPSVSDSWVLRLKVYTITPGSDGGFIHKKKGDW